MGLRGWSIMEQVRKKQARDDAKGVRILLSIIGAAQPSP